MIWILVQILLVPLFILVVAHIVNLVLSYYSLNFYRKQNITTRFEPLFGYVKLFLGGTPNDDLSGFKLSFDKFLSSDDELIAINDPTGSSSIIVPIAPRLVKALLSKEVEFTRKDKIIHHLDLGFIDYSGELAFLRRNNMKEFFGKDNIQKLTPDIQTIFEKRVDNFISKNFDKGTSTSSQSFKEIDFTNVLENMYADVVDLIILNDPKSKGIKIQGMRMSSLIAHVFKTLSDARKKPISFFTFSLYFKWGIDPKVKEAKNLLNQATQIIWGLYSQKRETYLQKMKEGKDLKTDKLNLIDMIIAHNLTLPDRLQWKKEDIVAHICALQLGGADTTLNLTKTFIDYLSRNSSIKNQLLERFQKVKTEKGASFSIIDIMEDEIVDSYAQEAIRMFGPAPISTRRIFLKNVKIGGYKFRKGDQFFIPLSVVNQSSKVHDRVDEFDVDRMKPENRQNIDSVRFAPFSTGQRACVGQYLAFVIFKMSLYVVLSKFEIEEVENIERKMVIGIAYGLENCVLRMRPRV